MEFLEQCDLSPEDKERFAHRTAEKLLKLDHQRGEIVVGSSAAGDAWYRWSSRAKSKIGRTLISALVK
jgi:2,3-dihydroxybenzoate decarboxylase